MPQPRCMATNERTNERIGAIDCVDHNVIQTNGDGSAANKGGVGLSSGFGNEKMDRALLDLNSLICAGSVDG